jgi:hypothetical protein
VQYCRERPEGLPPVEVILGNEDKGKNAGAGASGGGRGGKGGRGGGMQGSGEWSRGAQQQQFSGRGGRGGPGMPGMPFAPVPGKFGAPPGLAAPIARGPGGRGGGPPGGPVRRGPKKIPGRETPPPGIMAVRGSGSVGAADVARAHLNFIACSRPPSQSPPWPTTRPCGSQAVAEATTTKESTAKSEGTLTSSHHES